MAYKSLIGLDIGFSLIKAVVVDRTTNPPKLLSLGQVASPQPGIVSESENDHQAVANAIVSLIKELNPPGKDVVVALPESRIFTRVIYDFPYLSDSELAQAIRYAAEEFVPMPIQDVNLNYNVIYRSPKGAAKSRTIVFVVAAPKMLIDKYLKIIQMADLKPIAIETELIASARSLVSANPYSPTTLIIELGGSATDFAVVTEGLIIQTRSIPTGGLSLTRSIAQNFDFELPQAEEYKKVYGLLEDQLEGKLYQTIKPIVDIIAVESKRIIQTYEQQNPQKPVKRVILTGGGAKLPGIVSFFASFLGLEVEEADPWTGITTDPTLRTKLASEGPLYSVSAGLALKEE